RPGRRRRGHLHRRPCHTGRGVLERTSAPRCGPICLESRRLSRTKTGERTDDLATAEGRNAMRASQFVRLVVVSGALVFLRATAWAQAETGTIAGVVRDSSGAVMPGVTVEAASPALIERFRTVTTNDQGLYRIVDLRPGLYTVTFTLVGFSTFRREGIDLTTGFTATVNADLRVGTIPETVTVSGESPVVDVQNVQQQMTFRRDLLDALPTTRRPAQLVTLIPGANAGGTNFHDVGGVGSDRGFFGVHGQRPDDMTYNFPGIHSPLFSRARFHYTPPPLQPPL